MSRSDLETVLKKNPFTSSLIKKWRKEIKQYKNGYKSLSKLSFVLPGDDIRNLKKAGDNSALHLEVLPHPFLGDPNAPIWILLLNPGYHVIDRYDHLGYCPFCKKICCRKGKLRRRQKLLFDQLQFKCQRFFSAFDAAFKESYTLTDFRNCGIYRWWQKCLWGLGESSEFLINKNCDEICAKVGGKIFALECFPYHSKKFSMSLIKKSKYYNFWCELVSWAVDNKKYFILRSENIRQILLKDNVNLPVDRVVRIKNCRNVALTKDNLIAGESDALNKVLGILKSKEKGE